MSTFGIILIAVCVVAFLLGLFMPRTRTAVLCTFVGLGVLGTMFSCVAWLAAHYAPIQGSDGVFLRGSESEEQTMSLIALLNIVTFWVPLAFHGLGGWLRKKTSRSPNLPRGTCSRVSQL